MGKIGLEKSLMSYTLWRGGREGRRGAREGRREGGEGERDKQGCNTHNKSRAR